MKRKYALTFLACTTVNCGANALPYEHSYCIAGEAGENHVAQAAVAFLATPIENLKIAAPLDNRAVSSGLAKCQARYGWNEKESQAALQFVIFSTADNILREQLYDKSFDVNVIDRVYKKEPGLEAMLGLWTLPEYRGALAERLKEAGVPDGAEGSPSLIDEAMNLIRSRMLFEKVMQQLEFPMAEG